MAKEIYLPSPEELKAMESFKNVNIYKYLLAKNTEKLLSAGHFINDLTSDLKDIPELVTSICYIYPEELSRSEVAKNNLWLCRQLLNRTRNRKVYDLDILASFDKTIQNDYGIILMAIDSLYEELSHNPEYRFNYKQNEAVDTIFLMRSTYFNKYPKEVKQKLVTIEPAYTLRFPNDTPVADNIRVAVSIDKYSSRYGIPYDTGREYLNKSIFENHDKKVKTLIKNLYH